MSEPNDDVEARMQRFREELSAAPLVEVTGVVDPSGVVGGQSGGEELWTLLFAFNGWRSGSGAVQTEKLTIRRHQVTEDELEHYRELLTNYGVFKISARVLPYDFLGTGQALLVEVIGPVDNDAELQAHAEQLQQPATFEDPTFGTLTLDRAIDRYEGQADWNGAPASLWLATADPDELADLLTTAWGLWQNQAAWNERILDYAVENLLPLKNDTWLGEGEEELTPAQFRTRMTLDSVSVEAEGCWEFWYDDGDLFSGHVIHVSGDLTHGPQDVEIAG